jgi:hypothetical protein
MSLCRGIVNYKHVGYANDREGVYQAPQLSILCARDHWVSGSPRTCCLLKISLRLSLFLSLSLSVCLSVSISPFNFNSQCRHFLEKYILSPFGCSLSLSLCLSVCLSVSIYVCLCLSVSLSLSISVSLSLSVCLSPSLSNAYVMFVVCDPLCKPSNRRPTFIYITYFLLLFFFFIH